MIARPRISTAVVIPQRRAALCKEDLVISGGGHLLGRVPKIVRGEELALLDVQRRDRRRRGDQQVGLAARKAGIWRMSTTAGDRRACAGLVDVGRHPERRAALPAQNRSPSSSRGPGTRDRAPVRLVEGGLEHERYPAAARIARCVRQKLRVLFAFDHARTGDAEPAEHRPRSLDRARFEFSCLLSTQNVS